MAGREILGLGTLAQAGGACRARTAWLLATTGAVLRRHQSERRGNPPGFPSDFERDLYSKQLDSDRHWQAAYVPGTLSPQDGSDEDQLSIDGCGIARRE